MECKNSLAKGVRLASFIQLYIVRESMRNKLYSLLLLSILGFMAYQTNSDFKVQYNNFLALKLRNIKFSGRER